MSTYRQLRLDRAAPLSFRVSAWLRRTAIGRLVYRVRRNRAADVYLLSFPKAGRTWLRLLLSRALTAHFETEIEDAMELDRLADRNRAIPRIRPKHDDNPHLKTPEELVTKKTEYADRKVILLLRDVRDLSVSTYFQMTKRERRFEGDIGAFLRCRRGSVDTMIRFHEIWYANRDVPADLLVVRYEDLHADTAGQLRRVLAFVGVPGVADETILEAVRGASFGNMRRMEEGAGAGSDRLRPTDAADPESFKTRRGKVGGFVDYLSAEEIAFVNERLAAKASPFVY